MGQKTTSPLSFYFTYRSNPPPKPSQPRRCRRREYFSCCSKDSFLGGGPPWGCENGSCQGTGRTPPANPKMPKSIDHSENKCTTKPYLFQNNKQKTTTLNLSLYQDPQKVLFVFCLGFYATQNLPEKQTVHLGLYGLNFPQDKALRGQIPIDPQDLLQRRRCKKKSSNLLGSDVAKGDLLGQSIAFVCVFGVCFCFLLFFCVFFCWCFFLPLFFFLSLGSCSARRPPSDCTRS